MFCVDLGAGCSCPWGELSSCLGKLSSRRLAKGPVDVFVGRKCSRWGLCLRSSGNYTEAKRPTTASSKDTAGGENTECNYDSYSVSIHFYMISTIVRSCLYEVVVQISTQLL